MDIGVIPSAFWSSVTMQAMNPEVVYLGPMPADSHSAYMTEFTFPLTRPGKPAFVYILMASDGSVLYVGKARTPGNRFDRHRRHKDWWTEVEILLLLRVTGDSKAEADAIALQVERLGIRKLDPIYNVAGVCRRGPGFSMGVYA